MDTVVDVIFSHDHPRAHKARLGRLLGKPLYGVLVAGAVLCVLLGFLLLSVGLSLGWIMIGFAAIPAMYVEWYNGELKSLAPSKRPTGITDVIAGDILGQLGKNPTPKDIALAASSVYSGQFFGVRFGLTGTFLHDIASENVMDSDEVWRQAVVVREKADVPFITGGVLVIALMKTVPEKDGLLAHLNLDDKALMSGLAWQNHLEDLIQLHDKPRRTGGVARDFSFGYIPLLRRFGQNISELIGSGRVAAIDLEAHEQAIDQLVETFGSGGRQNAALVGPTGVGKTTVIYAFADRLLDAASKLPKSLKFRQIFILDSAALISAAPGRGELEGLVMQVLAEAYGAKNIIICLDNAQLFFEEGIGSVDLSNVLLPILEAGNLRVILSMDEQRFLQISQRNPALANALNRISIAEANEDETMRVMQDQIITIEFKRKVTFSYQALQEAYRLSKRYVHDVAMPGRALKLVEASASYHKNGLVTMNSVQAAIEKTLDVKVGVANDAVEREKLLNLEELIHQRMINQTRAVGVVSDALRRARAGVRNQNRPIGTFLFLGPTGVGKTELAKALADVYFGGEDRIIRLDLNEFVSSSDVARLIADGADDPSSLTAQAMKQPFSVVLLDEIEKAHPSVLTTLLQLLDEGILRDVKNREVSFRDAIVIATSNAGADRIREFIERGYRLEDFEEKFIDELISAKEFKPEFLNRFDEIVVFRPLEKPELLQVIDLMIASVNKTLEPQKITVSVAQDAKEYLVDRGYDPRLGARPMRRVVQRAVENTVAKQVLAGGAAPGAVIEITRDQVESILGGRERADELAADSSKS